MENYLLKNTLGKRIKCSQSFVGTNYHPKIFFLKCFIGHQSYFENLGPDNLCAITIDVSSRFSFFFIQNKSFIDMNFITNQGWKTLSKYKGWLKIEEKPNKSSKIAILIKDDTRTCTKYRDNVHLKGAKHTLQKCPFAWLHI